MQLRPAPAMLATAAAVLSAGCGAARLRTPDPTRPFTTGGVATRAFPQVGVRFQAPADWIFDPGQAPLVASTSSGSATVAIWRYPRTEQLPATGAALTSAGQALTAAASARDPTFKAARTQRVRVDGAHAVQVTGTGTIAGQPRQVRSTHIYAKGAEFVVDQFAAPRDFPLIDRTIFQPLLRSLKIDPPA